MTAAAGLASPGIYKVILPPLLHLQFSWGNRVFIVVNPRNGSRLQVAPRHQLVQTSLLPSGAAASLSYIGLPNIVYVDNTSST